MSSIRKLLVLAACACAAAIPTAPASAQVPCWKLLLNDWYGGSLTHIYPVHCYREAIDHLPSDVKEYSSARDDILRAMQQAIAEEKKTHHTVTAIEPAPSTTTTGAGSVGGTTTTKKQGPVPVAIKHLSGGGVDTFPLPLLILGGLALLLVAAGVGGLFWRRYQGRRGSA